MQQCKQEAKKVINTQWSIKQKSAHSHIPGEEAGLEKRLLALYGPVSQGEEEGRAISRKILVKMDKSISVNGTPVHIPSLCNKGGIGGDNWEVAGPQNGGTWTRNAEEYEHG